LPHLVVAAQQSSWDGDGTLSADFGGITAGTPVSSEADLGLYRAALTFDLLPTDTVELGIGVGATYADLQLDVDGGGTSESIEGQFPVPLLAVRGGFRIWRIDLQALLAGLTWSSSGDEVSYFEGDLSGRLSIFGRPGGINATVILGWHRIDFDAEFEDSNNDVEADLTFDGPYVGLQIGI
jgi:hypothetical protein